MKQQVVKYDEKYCLEQMALGDEKAFDKIYVHHRDKVFQTALYYIHCPFIIADLMLEVFEKVWLKRQRVKSVEHFRPFLLAITRNMCINYLRKMKIENKRMSEYSPFITDAVYEVEERLLAKELHYIKQKAVENLPAKRKLVYRMAENGCDVQDISRLMRVSVFTVKAQQHIANKKVRMYVNERLGLGIIKNESVAA